MHAHTYVCMYNLCICVFVLPNVYLCSIIVKVGKQGKVGVVGSGKERCSESTTMRNRVKMWEVCPAICSPAYGLFPLEKSLSQHINTTKFYSRQGCIKKYHFFLSLSHDNDNNNNSKHGNKLCWRM